jgi:hypothetical protein
VFEKMMKGQTMSDLIAQIQAAQRDAIDEIERLRAALNFIAQHFSSDWPERCQSNVLTARCALQPPNQRLKMADQRNTPEPTPAERDRLRAAQAKAVMPLIGPLLDAWECGSQSLRSEHPELDKHLRRINRAMEDAGDDWPNAEVRRAQRPKMR